MLLRPVFFGIFLAIFASTASAQNNLAIIINNIDHQNLPNATVNMQANTMADQLADVGFRIRNIRNMNSNGMARLTPTLRREIAEADRVLIFSRGYVVSSGRESWLLATDANMQGPLQTGTSGLPIGELIDIMGENAGAAILLLAEIKEPANLGPGMSYGYIPHDIAQGVTVFTGRADALADLVRDRLLIAGTSTVDAARAAPRGVSAYGFLSPTVAFLPKANRFSGGSAPAGELEQLIWENAVADGSPRALKTYLERFPNGRFSARASEMLAQLQRSPLEVASDTEVALGLSREQRQDIQRNLSLLGFDTRGVDGIFGRGSRAAVRGWQHSRGMNATGYLNGNQITVLDAVAAARAAELEEEARQRRELQDRQDAAFWRDTGRRGGENGLRAYLKKYPDGLYSDIALDRLQVFDDERRRSAAIAEGNAWDVARGTNSIAGYTDFLRSYPNGDFAEHAKEKLAALNASQGSDAVIQEERRVMNNPITRVLVEQQLASLGFKPGKIDGKIDADSRKAIRQFQRATNIPVSGYMTQATIVRLLSSR